MRINTKQAVKRFYSNASFELIYLEAVANALDANATNVNISIYTTVDANNNNAILPKKIVIRDNGVGFDDVRFGKFTSLLEVDEKTHKGVGRLVFLNYFDTVDITSVFANKQKRQFTFSTDFDGESSVTHSDDEDTFTELAMQNYNGMKIHDRKYLLPTKIKDKLLEVFYMRLYLAKRANREITIKITTDTPDTEPAMLNSNELPNFSVQPLEYNRDLFAKADIYYYIKPVVSISESKLITALSVDERTNNIDVIAQENIPQGYEMVFLLVSDSFMGKVDDSRQNLTLSDVELQNVRKQFRYGILQILEKTVPKFRTQRKSESVYLHTHFPHLDGYFDEEEVCVASRNDLLKKAQDRFFYDQKEILSAADLTDAQYSKSMDVSARILAEYILFRQRTIERLQKLTPENKERDFHNILVPQYETYEKDKFVNDIYRNNVWVLDDKFMAYSSILSEKEMSDVVKILTNGKDNISNDDRPDITILFSKNPNTKELFDVVIVELKRLGIGPERNSDLLVQLNQRARDLSKYYGNNIQRIWYYGVADIDQQTRLDLRTNKFVPLFSKGNVFYQPCDVFISEDPLKTVHAEMYILDFEGLVEDARARNETFMNILSSQIKNDISRYRTENP